MNDLELLRQLGDETRLPEPGETAAARARLLARLAQDPVARRRRLLSFGGVSVAAAAVAVGVLITAPGVATSPRGAISVHLTARQVLDRAAAAALGEPTVIPRPDQFVYTKDTNWYGAAAGVRSLVTEYWHSVDGSRNSLITSTLTYTDGRTAHSSQIYPGCRNGHYNSGGTPVPAAAPSVKPGQTVPSYPVSGGACTAWPAFLPDMPTTASEMLRYLERTQGVKPGDPASLFHAIAEMGSEYYLPAQRAALYQLLATTPGLTAVQNVHDVAGRPGVGIRASVFNMVLIFDPQTYASLGYNFQGGGGATLQIAIVGQVDQLP